MTSNGSLKIEQELVDVLPSQESMKGLLLEAIGMLFHCTENI